MQFVTMTLSLYMKLWLIWLVLLQQKKMSKKNLKDTKNIYVGVVIFFWGAQKVGVVIESCDGLPS